MAKQPILWDKDNKTTTMEIQILQGEFSTKDAIELITQMIQIKIKYHEGKILENSSEEDIKYRESKIRSLQNELYKVKNMISEQGIKIKLDGVINIK
jgi:hypothetical protein